MAAHAVRPPARSARSSPFDVEVEDIAHGLRAGARGGTARPSASIFSRSRSTPCLSTLGRGRPTASTTGWPLAILLHDAPEFVIGDMITPFKAVIGDSYKIVEAAPAGRDPPAFGLPPAPLPDELRQIIKTADSGAAFPEATHLAGLRH